MRLLQFKRETVPPEILDALVSDCCKTLDRLRQAYDHGQADPEFARLLRAAMLGLAKALDACLARRQGQTTDQG